MDNNNNVEVVDLVSGDEEDAADAAAVELEDLANRAVDLVSSDDDDDDDEVVGGEGQVDVPVQQVVVGPGINMRFPIAPCAKPSIKYGRGRSANHPRAYSDAKYAAQVEIFKGYVSAAVSHTRGFFMFPRTVPIKVEIWCFTRRPNKHFINKIRAPDRLQALEGEFATLGTKRPDADNFAKFYLDGMTGLIFCDDAQVVDLHVVKLFDNEGTCEGRMTIRVSPCFDVPMPDF